MKSNDKLIAVAIGSILVVGAFMVGIPIGLPDVEGTLLPRRRKAPLPLLSPHPRRRTWTGGKRSGPRTGARQLWK